MEGDGASLFGSVLRDDFNDESDIDLLVVFASDVRGSLLDLVTMRFELEAVFGRPVDLVEKDALVNPFRRAAILQNKKVINAA